MKKPILTRCSWITEKRYYLEEESLPALILYPENLGKGEQFATPSDWIPLFHQTAGYACNHLHFHAMLLTPEKAILPLMDSLHKNWEDSCVSAPPCFETAKKYQEELEKFGLSANHSYHELQEGFYPIDIEFLKTVTSTKLPKKLDDLIVLPKRKKPSFLDWLPHHWGLAILGQNCD